MTSHSGNASPRSNFQKQLQRLPHVQTHEISPNLMFSRKLGDWEICQLTDKTTQTWKIEGSDPTPKYVEALARELFATKAPAEKIEGEEQGYLIAHVKSLGSTTPLYVQNLSTKHFQALNKNQNPCTLTPQRSIASEQLQQMLSLGKMVELNDLIQQSFFYEAAIAEAIENTPLQTLHVLKLFFLCMEHKCYPVAQLLLKFNQNRPDLKVEMLAAYLSKAQYSNCTYSDYPSARQKDPLGPPISYAVEFFGYHPVLLHHLFQAGLNFFDPKIYWRIAQFQNPVLIEFWYSLCPTEEKPNFIHCLFKELAYADFSSIENQEERRSEICRLISVFECVIDKLGLHFQGKYDDGKWLHLIVESKLSSSLKRLIIDLILKKATESDRIILLKHKDWSERTPLCSAIYRADRQNDAGDGEFIRYLIEQGSDVNFVDDKGRSPLYLAAVRWNIPLVNLLIKKGANLDQKIPDSPLYAVLDGALGYCTEESEFPSELIELLIAHTPNAQAQVQQYIAERSTSLNTNPIYHKHWNFFKRFLNITELESQALFNYLRLAFQFHDHPFIEEAAQKKPDILEMTDSKGRTLLFQLFSDLSLKEAHPKDIAIVHHLLAIGKKLNRTRQSQEEILIHLAKDGKVELIPLILSDVASITTDDSGRTLLHYLAARGKPLEPLAKYVPDTYRGSEIEQAILTRNLSRIKELCDAKMHLKCFDKQGRSALHHAVILGDVEVFNTIYPYYKSISLPIDYERKNPLQDAFSLGSVNIIRQFDPKASHFTPSSFILETARTALTNRQFAEVEALLQAGFTCRAVSNSNSFHNFIGMKEQPLGHYFAQKGDLPTLQWLKSKNLLSDIVRSEIFRDAILSGKPEIVEFFISEGVPTAYFTFTSNPFAINSPLFAAIARQSIPILRVILETKDLFKSARDLIIDVSELKMIGTTDNPEVLQLFCQYLTKYNQERLINANYAGAASAKELKLIRFLLQRESRLKGAEIEEVIQIVQQDLGSFEKLEYPVFTHLLKRGKTVSEWRVTIALIKEINDALDRLDIEDEDEKQCIALTPILKEIFDYVFGRLSSENSRSEEFLPKLANAIRTIQDKTQIGFLFNGLKTQASIEAIEDAIDISLLYFRSGVPPKKDFANLSFLDQKKWLHYISAVRLREGLELCYFALKNQTDRSLLLAALSSIEKIAVPLTDKQRGVIHDLYELSRDSEIRIGCLKALWETLPDPYHQATRDAFFTQLKKSTDLIVNRTLISLLCHYHYDRQDPNDQEILDRIIGLSHSSDLNMRVQSALSLSQVLDEPCLLRATEIVQSSDWESYDSEFRGDEVGLFAGDPYAFIKKPDFQDNRASMLKLIQDQLAEIHWKNVQPKVEELYAEFVQTPEKHPQLQKLKRDLETLPKIARYLHLPIYFPTGPGRVIFRGMKARKGEKILLEAIRDLIKKGCGSSDLSYFEARFDFGTWSKVGHIFGSHAVKTAETYSDDKDGIIICFDPEYYNFEYRKRYARLEIEGTLNTVNYRGIPKHAIRRIYMPDSYRSDYKLLYSDQPLDKVKSKLRTEAFKNISDDQLLSLRRHLREPIPLLSQGKPLIHEGKPLTKPYFESFRFYARETKEEIFSKDLKPITVEEIHEETLKRAIGRQLIQEKYTREKSPGTFMAQDEMLHQLSDSDFIEVAPTVFEDLIKEREQFQIVMKGKDAPKPIRQHTLELIIGSQRHTGLNTQLNVSSISQERCRAALRLAALYYFTGKLTSQPHCMLPHTLEFADQHLNRHAILLKINPQDNILIHSILENHRLFKKFTQDELKAELMLAWKNLAAHPISHDDYVKMLQSFYAATVDLSKHPQTLAFGSLNDRNFKTIVEKLLPNLPYPFESFNNHSAGHGRKPNGKAVNLLEHTLEVICGQFGGFGLKTELTLQGLSIAQIRKVLRLAALFHDSGKIHGRKGHIAGSAQIARMEFEKDPAARDLSPDELLLIESLILNNDAFGEYYMGKIDIDDLQHHLHKSYQSLKFKTVKLSEVHYRKLLFALWIADASTLTTVSRKNQYLYGPLSQNLDQLDFIKLSEISSVGDTVRPEALPNFSKVSDNVYRGGQPTKEGLKKLKSMGIKTLISFRTETALHAEAKAMGFNIVSLPIDGNKPESVTNRTIEDFLTYFLEDEIQPIFMYCLYGADRTGFNERALSLYH